MGFNGKIWGLGRGRAQDLIKGLWWRNLSTLDQGVNGMGVIWLKLNLVRRVGEGSEVSFWNDC